MMNNASVVYRTANENDYSFIINSWLKTYRRSKGCVCIPSEFFYDNHKKLINSCLSNPFTKAAIVADPEDSSHIFSYLIHSYTSDNNLIIHYAYTKQLMRNFKIVTNLIKLLNPNDQPVFYTHDTFKSRAQRQRATEKFHLILNPYLFLNNHDQSTQ